MDWLETRDTSVIDHFVPSFLSSNSGNPAQAGRPSHFRFDALVSFFSHFQRLCENTSGIQAIAKNNNNLTTNGNNNNNKHLGSIIQFHVYSASLIMRWWVNNKMEMISCVNSKGFADESTWIFWVNFGWTWYHFYFFLLLLPLSVSDHLWKKSSGHWETREAQNRYRQEVGERNRYRGGDGRRATCQGKKYTTVHYKNIRYLHLIPWVAVVRFLSDRM